MCSAWTWSPLLPKLKQALCGPQGGAHGVLRVIELQTCAWCNALTGGA